MKKLTKAESRWTLIIEVLAILISAVPLGLWPRKSMGFDLFWLLAGVGIVLIMVIFLYFRTRRECSFFAFLYHTGAVFVLLAQLYVHMLL